MYSLSDAFAVPASPVRVFLADRVGQSPIEGPRPDDAGQEITQLRVQLRRWWSMRDGWRSCVHLGTLRRRFLCCVRRLQFWTTACFSHLKHVIIGFVSLPEVDASRWKWGLTLGNYIYCLRWLRRYNHIRQLIAHRLTKCCRSQFVHLVHISPSAHCFFMWK